MTARARPWMKFAPRRWQQDMNLRVCSASARGLWMEIICLMHHAEPYGHLVVHGRQPTDGEIAILTAIPMVEVVDGLQELEENGVFSRTDDGTIFCRGMVRDAETHDEMSSRGKKGAAARYQRTNGKTGSYSRSHGTGHGRGNGTPHDLESKRGESPPIVPPLQSKRALPDDWEPEPFGSDSQCHRIIADWSNDELASHAESFAAHHRSKGSRYLDWQEAWKTWVLNSERFDRRDRPAPAKPRSFAEIVLREVEAEKARDVAERRTGEKV